MSERSLTFLWGAASSAFQYEGAAHGDGKGPSVWDLFCHTPGAIADGTTADEACDHFRRFREDVELMQSLGLSAYRFSVGWPRVMPEGRGSVNEAGLDFYDRLVDDLRRANIEPMVTLCHWDLPAALQSDFGGWAGADVPKMFADYAGVVFDRLGDRVRLWLTLNEPWVVVDAGYFHGVHPPGVRDERLGYLAGHHQLLAHAYAVAEYRARGTCGHISLAINSTFSFPVTESPEDAAAAERAMRTFAGWFADPPYFGTYPAVMRERLGELLPEINASDAALLRGSMDFIALNYYFSDQVRHRDGSGRFDLERLVPDTPRTAMNWPIVPDGLRRLLLWLHNRYRGLPIYVTENGAAFPDSVSPEGEIHDAERIRYLRDHLRAAEAARDAGVDLRGYFVWSLLDNFEWAEGFTKRFGIVYCDCATQKRIIKDSGRWYAELIRAGGR